MVMHCLNKCFRFLHILFYSVFSQPPPIWSFVVCTCVGGIYGNVVHIKSLVVELSSEQNCQAFIAGSITFFCAACRTRSEGRIGDHDKEQMWQFTGRKHLNFPAQHLNWSETNHVVWLYINNRAVLEAWLVDILFILGSGVCFYFLLVYCIDGCHSLLLSLLLNIHISCMKTASRPQESK